jgi:hypothetical protein
MEEKKLNELTAALGAAGYELAKFEPHYAQYSRDGALALYVNPALHPEKAEQIILEKKEAKGPRTNLQRAIDALEDAGFHFDRAYKETNRDAGNVGAYHQEAYTGAICLRITPAEER